MDVQRDNDALAGRDTSHLKPVSLDNSHLQVPTPVTFGGEGGGGGGAGGRSRGGGGGR